MHLIINEFLNRRCKTKTAYVTFGAIFFISISFLGLCALCSAKILNKVSNQKLEVLSYEKTS